MVLATLQGPHAPISAGSAEAILSRLYALLVDVGEHVAVIDDKVDKLSAVQEATGDKGYYSVAELAQLYRCHPKTVERWLREGNLAGLKLGKGKRARWLVPASEVQAPLQLSKKSQKAARPKSSGRGGRCGRTAQSEVLQKD